MLYVKFTKETWKSSRVDIIGTGFLFGILALVYSLLVLSFYNINVVIKIINVSLCDNKLDLIYKNINLNSFLCLVMWKIFIFCYTPFFIHLYVYFVICLIDFFYINNIFIEISCFVVPFIDNLICFWLTTGIKQWIWKCQLSVNYWNPTKVKSWCGTDMEMQGDSTLDQY